MGRVKRNAYDIYKRGSLTRLPSKVFGAKTLSRGYPVVNLRRDGEQESRPRLVHHLVLDAFVGKRTEGTECAHKDGNPLNASLVNLHWVTPKQNQADKLLHGTLCRGESRPNAKLNDELVRSIRQDNRCQSDIAAELGISPSSISRVVGRKIWKHVCD